ncbi:MAG: MMPL family transporter [Candidatus Sericytochromatia bacterium]
MLERWAHSLYRWRRAGLPVLVAIWLLGLTWLALDKRPLPRLGSEGARQSEATAVQSLLKTHFGLRPENTLALVSEHQAAPADVLAHLRAHPDVSAVHEVPAGPGRRHRLYLIQLDLSLSVFEVENRVPVLRSLIASNPTPGSKLALTGQQAFLHDAGQASKKDTSRAERWGVLLAFGVLLWCFGSLSGAAIPLLLGLTTLLSIQLGIRWLGLGSSQSTQILNSMVGLGLSVDYALFMLSRYREERLTHGAPVALATVLTRTGRTVAYSAGVMLASLAFLLIPDVDALRGTVLNLLLVVALAALNALLLLPLLLATLDRTLDWPRWLSRRILPWHHGRRWRALAWHVTGHPVRYALLATALLLALALPLTHVRLWEPLQTLAPAASESQQALNTLTADGWGGEIMPVQVLVTARTGQSLREPELLAALYRLSQRLGQLPEVAGIQGPVNPSQPLESYTGLYQSLGALGGVLPLPELPFLRQTPGGERGLIQVYPRQIMDMQATYRLLDGIAALRAEFPELALQTGGAVARARSYTAEMYRPLGLMVGGVMLSIVLLLARYLRSVVLPLKAAVMNFLPILSAFGLMVWAFQDGGLAHKPGLTNIVPLTLFCIVFGLSMDYEVLILSRIDESWKQGHGVREAVVNGLSQSSGLITGAALILLGVFAPGMASSSAVVQELSLGITATIVLDATLVRLLLVPSLMMLMGRWNWWNPFSRRPMLK